ncbi:MAG: hypothetical protein JW751_08055 [Polyangiaceae bacterium]|nr:hypothetical protein [Polyangiaceae bacterium]
MKKPRLVFSVVAAAGVISVTSPAFAQTATATATANAGGRAEAVATDSDHDMMVGTFAVGYLGRRTVAYGTGSAVGPAANREVAQAPVIGARYWISPLLGIDVGVGFSLIDDGKNKFETSVGNVSTEQEVAPVTAFLFHAGVPLALSNMGHFSFQVIPEMNVGFASQKVEPGGGVENKATGFTLDAGARGGAEIHFGFIGVPQLSLQGSIGLLYRYEKWKMESSDGTDDATYSESRGSFTTTVYDNPWNIFTSNIAALYYF